MEIFKQTFSAATVRNILGQTDMQIQLSLPTFAEGTTLINRVRLSHTRKYVSLLKAPCLGITNTVYVVLRCDASPGLYYYW